MSIFVDRADAGWVICIEEFGSFGRWYDAFEPVTDEQVQGLLTRAEAIAGYAE